ncbi:MAG: hypothetical protein N2441_07465 [Rhodocyclaceae bacterium]|nr:hypothetical protein [Rhodocyclaceae bacterium]
MELLALAFGWAAYAALHSLLATARVKSYCMQRWPTRAQRYRLLYNLLALLLLIPLVWASQALPGEPLWRRPSPWDWLADALAIAACIGIWHVSRYYDMREFLGLAPPTQPILRISFWHRYVRHPWYALALVIVWTREMTPPMLVSALMITLYLVIGSRLEEKKLIALFGAAYERYREQVPAFLPRPWKRLSHEEAQRLSRSASLDKP